MRALILLVALAPGFAMAQKFGKTDAQIIAMGHDRWLKFSQPKTGGSTAEMVACEDVYGKALYKRNAALEAKLPVGRRNVIQTLRRDLVAYAVSMCEVGAGFTGGGTMWSPIQASVIGSCEETLFELIHPTTKKIPSQVVSNGTKRFKQISALIKKNSSDIDAMKMSGYGVAQVQDSLKGAEHVYSGIVERAKKLSRRDSDALIGYCVEWAQVPIGMAP